MRWRACSVPVAALAASALMTLGCDSILYGEGSLYLWNGTEHPTTFIVAGTTPGEVTLKYERGQLLEGLVAGTYTVTPLRKGVPLAPVEITLLQDRLTVYNHEGVGCFARTDVAGMYRRGRDPVRLLEIYRGEKVLALQDAIAIPPGQRLPVEAPRLSGEAVFQRLVVVPCKLTKGDRADSEVADFVRRLR